MPRSPFPGLRIAFYPPGTDRITGAEYDAFLYSETMDPGSMFLLQDKEVWIRVEDQDGTRLLDEHMSLRACGVKGEADWTEFEKLDITLYEEGVEYTGPEARHNQPYSVDLARRGPRKLMTLSYRFNEESGVFERARISR